MKKTVKILMIVLLVSSLSTVKAATLAYWEFDDKIPKQETVQGERIVDSSGNGRDIFVSSTDTHLPDFWPGDPNYGSVAALNKAVSDKVIFEPGHNFGDGGPVAGTAFDFGYSDSFTMEALIRCPITNDTSNRVCAILSKIGSGGSASPQWWWRVKETGFLEFMLQDDAPASANILCNSINIDDGKWHHVAVIRNVAEGQLKMYIDYVEVATKVDGTFGSFANDGLVNIGQFAGADNRDFYGSIDFIRISDVALTPDQFIQRNRIFFATNPNPANNAIDMAVPSVSLGWSPLSGTGITVDSQVLQVATDDAFANIIQTFNLSGTANNAVLTPVAKSRTYYWRVNTSGTKDSVPFSWTGSQWKFQTQDLVTDVAGYWAFNNESPGTVIEPNDKVVDSSGNGRNVKAVKLATDSNAIYDNPNANYGSGASLKTLNQARFDLVPGHTYGDGSVAGSGIAIPSTNGNLTIEAVVNPIYTTQTGCAIFAYLPLAEDDYWYGSDTASYYLRVNGTTGCLRFTFDERKEGTTIIGGTATGVTSVFGGWHHVAAVRDVSAQKLRVYIDGVLDKEVADITSTTANVSPTGYSCVAGFHSYPASRAFNGNIDFVKVTRAALSPAQFVQAFALPTNPNPVDGATGVPINYTLTWTPITGATITSQTVKIATDPYMQNVVRTIIASGNSANVTGLSNNTTYYWRVDTVGSDTNGPFNRQGTIWSFSSPSCLITVEMGNLYNADCIIDFKDFAIMANNWLASEFE
ncbi:MAG: hypothetical protein A2Y10_19875 [Planctomycetes bacterium GWF2_41_51]|nr:MAG: hypothetical protein A2Y10_19875 [Planctomycetes bacterium GWF2_41_51]HBG28544.1 hypothetical protein [Phycisphaerales bacterium]